MSCFFKGLSLFLVFLLFSSNVFSVQQSGVRDVAKKKNKMTASQRIKKQVVRKTIEKKQEKRNKASKNLFSSINIVKTTNKVINEDSSLCVFAAKNDIASLKKKLYKIDQTKNEDVDTICKNGESLLLIAVKNSNYISAKFLIDSGANVNIQNDAGVSPLHMLARIDSVDADRIFDILIRQKDLEINKKDIEGYTPIMRAVEFEKISMIRQLVKRGADVYVKNNYNMSAMDLAKKMLNGKKTDEEKAIAEHIIAVLNNGE